MSGLTLISVYLVKRFTSGSTIHMLNIRFSSRLGEKSEMNCKHVWKLMLAPYWSMGELDFTKMTPSEAEEKLRMARLLSNLPPDGTFPIIVCNKCFEVDYRLCKKAFKFFREKNITIKMEIPVQKE